MSARWGGAARWWRMVGIIVGLELRQRVRTTRWKVTLAALFAILSLAVFGSLYTAVDLLGSTYRDWSINMYAILVALLLFIGIVLAPTLTATSINGDRKDATLALVQATPISNRQLALGKLLGNWIASMGLVAIASPYLIWGIVVAPYGIGYGLLGIVVLAILFACYCGIGLGFSALTPRPAGSAVLTQASVFFLILGLPALFGILFATTGQSHEVIRPHYSSAPAADAPSECRDRTRIETFHHTERIWWMLAPNPFLLVADTVAAGDSPERQALARSMTGGSELPDSPSAAYYVAGAQSAARAGPYLAPRTCEDASGRYLFADDRPDTYWDRKSDFEARHIGANWYWGLAANLVLGAIGFAVAARRLRVPAKKLPRGVRIA